MSAVLKPVPWFGRAFSFDFPAELFPNLLMRLRGTPVRMAALTEGVPANRLLTRPGEAWSMQEHLAHLTDLEPLWRGRVDDILSGQPVMRTADLTNTKTWEAAHNRQSIGAVLDDFAAARAHLTARLQTLSADEITRTALHPRLQQPMRLVDLLHFVAEHDDHHLAFAAWLAQSQA